MVDEGTGQRWVFEHSPFGVHYLFVCFFSRSSNGSRRNWRTSLGMASKWWVQINKAHCLAITSSPIHHFIQVGTNTPTITGYFEVEVGGQVVHSKKVTWSCSLVPMLIFSLHAWYKLVKAVSVVGLACMFWLKLISVQNGDGFVDTKAKLDKVVQAVKARLAWASTFKL